MPPTVYLVSGANRGIGLGIVVQLATRPDTIIFAGSRNPDAATDLQKLSASNPGRVHLVKLTAGDVEDNKGAVDTIRRVAGRLDVVIANAAICKTHKGVFDSLTSDLREHWDVNVGGTHLLFQQTLPLLRSSPRSLSSTPAPKFIVVSATGGSIERASELKSVGMAGYRGSKAAVNFMVREIHFEHEEDGLVAFPICPGPVDTDMFNEATANITSLRESVEKMNFNVLTVEASVRGILNVIDASTRETHGGKFVNYAREATPW